MIRNLQATCFSGTRIINESQAIVNCLEFRDRTLRTFLTNLFFGQILGDKNLSLSPELNVI